MNNKIYLVTTRYGGELYHPFNNLEDAQAYYNKSYNFNPILTELNPVQIENKLYYYSYKNGVNAIYKADFGYLTRFIDIPQYQLLDKIIEYINQDEELPF